MTEVTRFQTAGGATVLVETTEDAFGIERAARADGGLISASRTLEAALDDVRPAIDALRRALQDLAPDRCDVQFGIKLNGEIGAIVAKTSVEGHFNVTVSWSRGATREAESDVGV